jgi:beta-lactamase class A
MAMIGRRPWIGGAAAALAAGSVRAEAGFGPLGEAFARIERAHGGRLGVAVLDAASGATAAHRPAERFPMASTFKLFVAGAVLARVDPGAERLDRHIPSPAPTSSPGRPSPKRTPAFPWALWSRR